MRSLRERLGLPDRAPARAVPSIVDAHHHLWDLGAVRYPWLTDEIEPKFMFGDYGELRRNYLPTDYLEDSSAQPIVATVHCEAEADRTNPAAETRWLAEQSARCSFPNALVVWADLVDPACAAQLEAHLAASNLVRGVRCKPRLPTLGSRSSPAGGLDDPNFIAGLRLLDRYGLSWDLRVPWWHLDVAAQAIARIPSLPVILNHCGLPWQRDEEAMARWRSGMRALAAQPNVCVKVSELGLADRAWSESDNIPVIRETIEIFGPERALFASNFPVARMRVNFDTWVAAVTRALEGFGPDDRSKVFSRNALRVYRIPTTDAAAEQTG